LEREDLCVLECIIYRVLGEYTCVTRFPSLVQETGV
jgi:hypothetical protein